MTGLFARLYFDEDVSARVAEMLKVRGFDVITTVEAHRLGASDRMQLEFATSQYRTLVTHNRHDFEQLAKDYFETESSHGGILIAVRRPPRGLAKRLLGVLNRLTSDELMNQIVYV
jgi:hypothetical protein